MQPTAKGLWLMDMITIFPAAVAGHALPLAHALVEALFGILPRLRHADPVLARSLRSAGIAVSHALVSARLASSKAHANRHLHRAYEQAHEVQRLLVAAHGLQCLMPGQASQALALTRQLLDRLWPAA
jgi:hypothetical protein